MDEKVLQEVSGEKEVVVRGKSFEVAREVVPFDKLMEMSGMLANSTIIPIAYQNRPENCFIAIDMASRMGISPMLLMQNLHIIQGKPSLSGQFIASLIRGSGQFRNVELIYVGTKHTDSWGAYVKAEKSSNGQEVIGGTVTLKIAKAEGWVGKTGSKWQTMPEIMLGYRAYAWFGRMHCPELLMGLQSSDEVEDLVIVTDDVVDPFKEG